jgi:hypothetical protein
MISADVSLSQNVLNVPGKKPASKTPIKNLNAIIVALFWTPAKPMVNAPHANRRIPSHLEGRM